jgi:hypothetical protein
MKRVFERGAGRDVAGRDVAGGGVVVKVSERTPGDVGSEAGKDRLVWSGIGWCECTGWVIEWRY